MVREIENGFIWKNADFGPFNKFDLFEIDLIQLNMLEIVLVRSDTFKNGLFGMFDWIKQVNL